MPHKLCVSSIQPRPSMPGLKTNALLSGSQPLFPSWFPASPASSTPQGSVHSPLHGCWCGKAKPETDKKLAGRAGSWCGQLPVPTSTPSQLQSCRISLEALLHPHPQSFPLSYSSHASSSFWCSSVQDCGVTGSG